eukprot:31121-Pelagococcus_subviridis.AAC.7
MNERNGRARRAISIAIAGAPVRAAAASARAVSSATTREDGSGRSRARRLARVMLDRGARPRRRRGCIKYHQSIKQSIAHSATRTKFPLASFFSRPAFLGATPKPLRDASPNPALPAGPPPYDDDDDDPYDDAPSDLASFCNAASFLASTMCNVAAMASTISAYSCDNARRGAITLCASAASSSPRTSVSSSDVSGHDDDVKIQSSISP